MRRTRANSGARLQLAAHSYRTVTIAEILPDRPASGQALRTLGHVHPLDFGNVRIRLAWFWMLPAPRGRDG
jgi:hypothetical protein